MTDKIKSDGGSSDYYKIKLPKSILKDNGDGTVTIETGDVIRYALNNDFNLGNIFKAMVRWGKKDGIDYEYDRNKIVYFTDDYVAAKKSSTIRPVGALKSASGWFVHTGNPEDAPKTTKEVLVKFRDGAEQAPRPATHYVWHHDGAWDDIMEWRYVD